MDAEIAAPLCRGPQLNYLCSLTRPQTVESWRGGLIVKGSHPHDQQIPYHTCI